ncbi:hypothetical protein [Brevundimonas phoenicis]|uniref:hypothetical protein n=1 Tax=unclassified Brevundimonas TaxID=2622653 RepID=UPI0039A38073
MNVLTLLRSVEELLYEVMSWLLFYPITFWRTLSRPLETMRYSDAEQRDKAERQYLETLSPPLFLVLSILLAHGLELALGFQIAQGNNALGRLVSGNDQALLGFRALIFSLPALLFACLALRLQKRRIDRDSLRAPFFAQCYLSGATAIIVSLGFSGARLPGENTTIVGDVFVALATVWYLWVQWRWIKQETALGPVKIYILTAATFGFAMMVIGAAALLVAS